MPAVEQVIYENAAVATGADTVVSPFAATHIVLVKNDGANDVRINFDAPALNGWLIKAGEAISNVPIGLTEKMFVRALVGVTSIRVYGYHNPRG